MTSVPNSSKLDSKIADFCSVFFTPLYSRTEQGARYIKAIDHEDAQLSISYGSVGISVVLSTPKRVLATYTYKVGSDKHVASAVILEPKPDFVGDPYMPSVVGVFIHNLGTFFRENMKSQRVLAVYINLSRDESCSASIATEHGLFSVNLPTTDEVYSQLQTWSMPSCSNKVAPNHGDLDKVVIKFITGYFTPIYDTVRKTLSEPVIHAVIGNSLENSSLSVDVADDQRVYTVDEQGVHMNWAPESGSSCLYQFGDRMDETARNLLQELASYPYSMVNLTLHSAGDVQVDALKGPDWFTYFPTDASQFWFELRRPSLDRY